MRFRICILLLCCLPGIAHAINNGQGGKDKDKDKAKCKTTTTDPTVEEFVFILPAPAPENNCAKHRAFRNSVVDFYKWYLQNEDRVSAGMAQTDGSKDLVPPFNISWQTLHEYFELIQKNYSCWINNIENTQFSDNSSANVSTAKGTVDSKGITSAPASNFPNTIN